MYQVLTFFFPVLAQAEGLSRARTGSLERASAYQPEKRDFASQPHIRSGQVVSVVCGKVKFSYIMPATHNRARS